MYRGYYYDTETGLYYLNSRYYDPQTGRFLNADFQIGANQDLTSYNLFAYCGNSPVNRADLTGTFWAEIGNWLKNTANDVATWVTTTANMIGNWVGSNPVTAFSGTVFGTSIQQAADDKITSKIESVKIKKQVWQKTPLVNARNTHVKTTVTLPDTRALKTVKGIAKKVGFLSIASFGLDIYQNTQKYSGGNIVGAIAIDSLSLGASVLMGIAATTFLPASLVFAGVLVGGLLVNEVTAAVKNNLLN